MNAIVRIAGCLCLAVLASQSLAATYNVGPDDLAPGKPTFSQPHGLGSNPFAYDWDSAKPEVASGAPVGYGDNSFYANVAQAGATQADRYRTFRLGTRDLVGVPGGTLELGELLSIEYQTNKPLAETVMDWRVTIYTTPGDYATDPLHLINTPGSGDIASWYRNRIQSLPQDSLSLNAPANQWNLWSTDAGTNQLQFYTNRAGFTADDIDWSDLIGGPVTRGANTWDFSGEEIMMIDFTLGANSGGGTTESQLDAIVLNFSNGNSVSLNLVPEPSTFVLAGLALLGLVGLARRRK